MNDYNTWAELVPITTDERATIGVQARIHDPLWLLGRQWMFGEFRHDGGATPVDVRIDMSVSQPQKLRPEARPQVAPTDIRPNRSPLESLFEMEPIPVTGIDGLRLRAEGGMLLLRHLRAAGLGARGELWATTFKLSSARLTGLDDETREFFELVEGRVPDGQQLGANIGRLINGSYAPFPLVAGELDVLKAWQKGAGIWQHAATATNQSWDPEHFEYRLSVAAMRGSSEVVLSVPEYVEGTLDWYAFDAGGVSLGAAGRAEGRRLHRLPSPLSFTGMPRSRFWTFEDPGVNFDAIDVFARPDAPPPSQAAMMALEFALSYGDDWYQVPVPLEPHAVCELATVTITDCFGDKQVAQPPAGRWNLFRHDDASAPSGLSSVFMHASPTQVLEGPPLEELHLLRDEQANLAWAVETIVQHPLGDGRPQLAPTTAAAPVDGLTWTFAPPTLPRHWFPLVAVTGDPGRLTVGSLWTARDAKPKGRLLGELTPGQRIHEEEVPSEGVQITRRWQFGRSMDGVLHSWIGRAKRPRQTDAAPGLRFDVLEKP